MAMAQRRKRKMGTPREENPYEFEDVRPDDEGQGTVNDVSASSGESEVAEASAEPEAVTKAETPFPTTAPTIEELVQLARDVIARFPGAMKTPQMQRLQEAVDKFQ